MAQVVAGNGVAVAGDRDNRGGMDIAIEVADQPADIAEEGGCAGALGHAGGHDHDADVLGDVEIEQRGADTEVYAIRHSVRGVVGDD